MDARLQGNNEMQVEELYALLDKAWESDRLCVSEDLIQKTLKRVAEEDTKVISYEKAAKRKLSPMKYVSVAAAAVFVLVIGVSTLGRSGALNDSVQMEATYDKPGRTAGRAESYDGGDSVEMHSASADWEYSSVSDSVNGMTAPVTEGTENDSRGGSSVLRGSTVALSGRLTDVLTARGTIPISENAECWEFVYLEERWEEALLCSMAAAEKFEDGLPAGGAYSYVLGCEDGSRETIHSEEALDLIVCIKTTEGTIWGLYGESVHFYME